MRRSLYRPRARETIMDPRRGCVSAALSLEPFPASAASLTGRSARKAQSGLWLSSSSWSAPGGRYILVRPRGSGGSVCERDRGERYMAMPTLHVGRGQGRRSRALAPSMACLRSRAGGPLPAVRPAKRPRRHAARSITFAIRGQRPWRSGAISISDRRSSGCRARWSRRRAARFLRRRGARRWCQERVRQPRSRSD